MSSCLVAHINYLKQQAYAATRYDIKLFRFARDIKVKNKIMRNKIKAKRTMSKRNSVIDSENR